MLTTTDIIALKSLQGIGDQTIRKIIRSHYSVATLMNLSPSDLKLIFRFENDIYTIKNNFDLAKKIAEEDFEKYESQSISVISYFDSNYPHTLSLIDDFPVLLFCKGNIDLFKSDKNIAVIGTRDNSDVGYKIAKSTATYFAKEGFTIVSGLAKGIDAVAHEGALEAEGNTIAVLVDIGKIYPKENNDLANRILSNNGLLISENSPGSFQGKNSFVLRDRIQSGLSIAIFPIETDVLGGTMHTVSYAKKQKRLIFVPDVFNNSTIAQYEKSAVGIGFSKINGIRELIKKKDALPYTRDNYNELKNKIEQHLLYLKKGIDSNDEKGNNLFLEQSSNLIFPKQENIKDELCEENKIKETELVSDSVIKVNQITTITFKDELNKSYTKEQILFFEAIKKFKSEFDVLTNSSMDNLNSKKIFELSDKFVKNIKKVIKTENKATEKTKEISTSEELFG